MEEKQREGVGGNREVAPSRPEPPPTAGGRSVTAALLAYLEGPLARRYPEARSLMKPLILERRAYGVAKYGQELMTDDGRDAFEDARQEIGDAAQYIFKMGLEGRASEAQCKEVVDHMLILTLLAIDRLNPLEREPDGSPWPPYYASVVPFETVD